MVSKVQEVVNTSSETALHMAAVASVGYLCARAFTAIDPIHGAAFCAASVLASKIVNPLFNRIFAGADANEASKTIGSLFSLGAGIAASAAIATFAGFPITFAAGATLTASMLALRAIVWVGLSLAATAMAS